MIFNPRCLTPTDAVSIAENVTGCPIVLIVGLSTEKTALMCRENYVALEVLHVAHEALINNPDTGKPYTKAQIHQKIDFWLERMHELYPEIETANNPQ